MSKISNYLSKIGNYAQSILRRKYILTIFVFILIIGFIDSNSLLTRYNIAKKNQALREQIADYNHQYNADKQMLYKLQHDPSAIEEIARMRLFMKTDNEDIYVIEEKPQ